jgi:aminoglycoside phosphotransferase (APT) family kinase protein
MHTRERRNALVALDQLEIAALLAPVVAASDIAKVELCARGGSSTNYRVETVTGQAIQVRLVPGGTAACRREVAILRHVSPTVPVPRVLFAGDNDPRHPYYIADWEQGVPLDEVLEQDEVDDRKKLGSAVGQTLARIHEHRFPARGDLNDRMDLVPWASESPGEARTAATGGNRVPVAGGSLYATYLHKLIFDSPAQQRLGAVLSAELWQAILRVDANRDWNSAYVCLTHFDYNPANLLVHQYAGAWKVVVLDWEFACVAGPLPDIGNMLRHRHSYPSDFVAGFIRGYEEQATWLQPGWIEHARFADLSASLEMLSSLHERPAAHAAASRSLEDFLGLP